MSLLPLAFNLGSVETLASAIYRAFRPEQLWDIHNSIFLPIQGL